jgi:ATP-dependent phosphofructokinase / diphosphate-dependent phosphofructokinase
MEKGSLLVIQSGGPTQSMNASLVGAITKGREIYDHIYGAIYGIDGLLKDQLVCFDETSEHDLEVIKYTNGSYLGSSKHRLNERFLNNHFNLEPDYCAILNTVKKYDIRGIVIIGGNYSMDGVEKLSNFFTQINYPCHIIGAPKTLDNDLKESDHAPGYGSSIKLIASVCEELNLDNASYDTGRVVIVEVTGGDTGWLTAGSKLACLNGLGPDLIYLPEQVFIMRNFLDDVKKVMDEKKRCLVFVSEGVRGPNGAYIERTYSYNYLNDIEGHHQLGGVNTILAQVVNETFGYHVRPIRFNAIQRTAAHYVSMVDINEAFDSAAYATEATLNETNKAVSIKRRVQGEYGVYYALTNVKEIVDQTKYFPVEWIKNGNDVSDEFIAYALPLIQGEYKPLMINGLPELAHLKK